MLKSTGVPAGLIPTNELRSKNAVTNAQKTAFLDRLVAFLRIGMCCNPSTKMSAATLISPRYAIFAHLSNSRSAIFVRQTLATNEPLEVRSSKVLAGLEPEKTNDMLAALARCALNAHNIDSAAISNQVCTVENRIR